MDTPELQRLNAHMHREALVSAEREFRDLLKRPSSDLNQQESADGDTDYRNTRRPTNTRSSIVPTLIVLAR